MTRFLCRAVRSVLNWLTEPINQNTAAARIPLCIEAWLNHSVRCEDHRDYPPRPRIIPLNTTWMVRAC